MKSLSEFYAQEKESKKKGNYIYYNPKCIECVKYNYDQWRLENPEKHNANNRKYGHSKKGLELKREMSRKVRKSGKYREWQRDNPDKSKASNEKRNLHKKHEISNKEWEECKKYFNHRCAYCGLAIEDNYIVYRGKLQLGDFHKEHVDDSGANDLSNCIPSCKSCNSSKHTSKLEKWYCEDNLLYSPERKIKIYKWLNEDYFDYIKNNKLIHKIT